MSSAVVPCWVVVSRSDGSPVSNFHPVLLDAREAPERSLTQTSKGDRFRLPNIAKKGKYETFPHGMDGNR